ncbi:hypothetical protein M9H77_13752 [Catharanthus roseus]|uniref:Uncharacterized protein n=1 Tax=Catharanthus roseus TaxID=4058 RepID=A0ACC0BL99_CATRO|nr:hypothetical protein M9H77_13752 [Catharanthus roseus]
MSLGEQIDDLIESDTIRLLDWNDAITDIQLGMRDHTVTYNQREVCRESGTRPDAYVPYIYSRETYRRTYQSNFYSIGYEEFWRDAPYNLTFYPPNMNNQQGRKQDTRFCGEMDYRNLIFSQDVDVKCTGIIEKVVITPVPAMYKFLFFKVL